ncbi:hypothetical protein DN585_00440 [Intrasporangium calvum]|nr:hypothetical protein DN585_00440 [Intrasporangium calvum]
MDVLEGPTAQQHCRRSGSDAEQVANRVRLARPGRPVEQDAALEVLPVPLEPSALPPDAEDVVLDAVERPRREDDVGRGEAGALEEGGPGQSRAVRVSGEGDHLTTQDAALVHQRAQASHEPLRPLVLRSQDLEDRGLATDVRVATQDPNGDRQLVVAEEADPRADHLSRVLRARPRVQPEVVDLPHGDPARPVLPALEQVAEREVVAHVPATDPDELRPGVGLRQLLQGDVGVDEPVLRDLLGDDGEPFWAIPRCAVRTSTKGVPPESGGPSSRSIRRSTPWSCRMNSRTSPSPPNPCPVMSPNPGRPGDRGKGWERAGRHTTSTPVNGTARGSLPTCCSQTRTSGPRSTAGGSCSTRGTRR